MNQRAWKCRLEVVAILAVASIGAATARDLVWTGENGKDWSLTAENWRLSDNPQGGSVSFKAGDDVLFSDGAITKEIAITSKVASVGNIVFSNETDTLVWSPSKFSQSDSTVEGTVEKFGAGTLKVTSRYDALKGSFTAHAGRFVAATGMNYPGEFYSVVGSLHDRRNVSFLSGSVLEVTADAVFGGLGAYCSTRNGADAHVKFLFDGATIEFNRDNLVHHFGCSVFRNCRFDYKKPVARMMFSCNQSFYGDEPYVIGNTGPDASGRGAVFNVRCQPDLGQSEVYVDDITKDEGDDVTILSPLIDITTGRESAGLYGVMALRKSGPGTLCIDGDGIGSTTGLLKVVEGTLRIASGTTAHDGRSGIGRINPVGKRTVSVSGTKAKLRFDAIVGPWHYPRNWELAASEGAEVILGEGLPFFHFGELSLAASTLDYSAVGGFGVSGKLTVTGTQTVNFPKIAGKAEKGLLTIGLARGDCERDDGVCRLEVAVADATGDASPDLAIGLEVADLQADDAKDNPYRGKSYRGRIVKSGSGTLQLTAANSYSGGTEVASGTLEVDGSVVGTVEVDRGGYVGGTGSVDSVTMAAGGGFSVRADDANGSALRVGSLATAGAVKVAIAGGYGRHVVFSDSPVVAIAERPAAVDVSSWQVFVEAEQVPMALSYDPTSGKVTMTGEVDIAPIAPPMPSGSLAAYYDIDWGRDTLQQTRDGTWLVPSQAEVRLEDGWLDMQIDDDEPLAFNPNEECNAQPYATFAMRSVIANDTIPEAIDIGDSAAALTIRRKADAKPVYCGATSDGWTDLFGVEPMPNGDGEYEAEVVIGVDESTQPVRVSYAVNGVRLHDASGAEWFARRGSGAIAGKLSFSGSGAVGNIVAKRSHTEKLIATRTEDGGWKNVALDEVPKLVAERKPYYLVLPEGLKAGERFVSKLSSSAVSSAGLGIWPERGMMGVLEESNGVWCATLEWLHAFDCNFVIGPGKRVFVNQLTAADSSSELSIVGVEGEERGMFGGELVLLNGSSVTPKSVVLGTNTRLTLQGQLGPDPIALSLAYGAVFDAQAVPGAQAVGALEVDCTAAFGSMSGVRLAKSGELRMDNVASVHATGQVPCDLSGVANPEAIMGWQFLADGKAVSDMKHYALDGVRVTWRGRKYPQTEERGWSCLPMWGGGYMQNVVLTSDPNIIYTYADVCGPFRSDNGAKSWQRIGANLPIGGRIAMMNEVRTLSVDPRNPDSIVAIGGGEGRMLIGGFMVSRNGGKSWRRTGWTAAYGNGPHRMFGTVLGRDPNDPDTLVGGEDWYGIFLSRDNGETWVRTGPMERTYTCIHWDRKVAGRVYACAVEHLPTSSYLHPFRDCKREPGLFVSEDSGATWRKVADEAPMEMTQIEGDNRLVGIFNRQHVCVSEDGGITWQLFEDGLSIPSEAPTGHGANLSYAALGCGSDFWLTGHGLGAIYRRNVGDAKWTRIKTPKFATTDPDGEIYEQYHISRTNASMSALCTLVVDPRDDGHWFTTDWFTIWETLDAGANFISRNVGISQLCSLTFEADPLDEKYLAYGVHDMTIFVSYDGGGTFKRPTNFWTYNYGGNGHVALPSIAYSPFVTGLVFAAGYDIGGGVGIAKSVDHGDHWTYPNCVGMPRRAYQTNGVNCVSFREGRTNEVWACVGGLVGPGKAGPYVSTDGGANWTWKGQGMDEGKQYYTIDTRNGGPVRCLAFSSDGSGLTRCKESSDIYRWIDKEGRWAKCTMPSSFSSTWKFHSMEADPFTPGRFLVGGSYRVAETLDGGASWRTLPRCDWACPQFAFDRHTPGLLVMACDDAVRVSWDGGDSFSLLSGGWDFDSGGTSVVGSLYSGSGIAQVTVDRKRLFIATSSGGVYQRRLVEPQPMRLLLQ